LSIIIYKEAKIIGQIRDGKKHGYEFFIGDCRYYCDTLVVRFLLFARRRRVDTYTARDCRNLNRRLAIDWQKVVEIT
jgi:hypothetical protein